MDERVRILGMLKEGIISVEESLKLLEALEVTEPQESPQPKAKWMRIRITEAGKDKPKVLVNLPISIIEWALKTGNKVANLQGTDLNAMGVNLDELGAAISRGFKGKIVDVEDENEKTRIEIEVE